MRRSMYLSFLSLIVAVVTAGCAPATFGGATGGDNPSRPLAMKRITLGSADEPDVRPSAGGGRRIVAALVHTGLTMFGDQRTRRARLAEAVPSLDNGLWKMLPDGRMETTWKLREGARWHDGVPLTTDDLLFSLEVGRDREMAGFSSTAYASIQDVRAQDSRTLTIIWKEPFIEADGVLDGRDGQLLPRHLLEEAYRGDKATVLDLPYWTSEFVGAGPYQVQEWTPSVGIHLLANDDFVLGRPKIDQIEVKVIPDANTLTANLLAGTVDVTHNLGSVDLGLQLRDQWHGGTVHFNFGDTTIRLTPQLLDPRPAALGDLQVRRALVHAIDRQEIVDTLVGGLSPVPHSFLSPNQAAYRDIEAALPRYEYDPRKAAQMLEASGYRKGTDGTYRDEANRRLELEVRSGPLDTMSKPAAAVADYWQQLGVDATMVRLAPQQLQDQQYLATFPAFYVSGGANDLGALGYLHSSGARLPSNNFRVQGGGNWSRYMNPEFDARLDRYFRTVPVPERIQALGEVIHQIADQVTLVGLYYNPVAGAASDRLLNVSSDWPGLFITWNAFEWDVRS
jgi:peptide/nickel transport system substrate-binding protein